MSEWLAKSYRRNLVDMHIEDWDEKFLSKFDPDEYYRLLKLGHVQSPMIYIQSHVGHCYWPTRSGHMHNALAGREDSVKRLAGLCRAGGMDVIAYYSLIYNNWAYEKHPEWRMIDADGAPSRHNGSRYGLCCPNNAAYREFVAIQAAEFCEYFDFDAIFLDMTFWPIVCYCDSCKERWEREVLADGGAVGICGDIPKVVDWQDPAWNKFADKRGEWLADFANYATGVIKKYKPGCLVEHQYSTLMHFWRYGVNENITQASDYAGGDLYGGIAEQSFAVRAYRNLTRAQPFEYMTSRCYPNLKEHTTTKSEDLLKLSVMTTLLHHGACLLIDAINPDGTMDERVYELYGKAFGLAKEYEPYLEGRYIADVGVYFNLNCKMDPDIKGKVASAEGENSGQPHLSAAMAAGSALRSAHIPYDVLNNLRLEQLRDCKAVVVSDMPVISEKELDAFREYVKNGGKLYLSGRSAPALVEEVFGVKTLGRSEEETTYIAPTDDGAHLMRQYNRKSPMGFFSRQVVLSGAGRGKLLATVTLPFSNNGKFASIHSDPPGIETEIPALLTATYGKGIVVWASCPIELPDRPQHRAIFANIIRMTLCGAESARGNGSDDSTPKRFDGPDGVVSAYCDEPYGVVELVLFDAPEKKRVYCGLLNIQEGAATIPVGGFRVFVKTPREPVKTQLLPEGSEIASTYENGYAAIRVENLKTCALYAFDY